MSLVATGYKIRLEGIRFRAKHGVSEQERSLPQDFVVDLEVLMPTSSLPQSDTIKDVFDYDRLSTLVVDVGTRQQFKLLEVYARRLIATILEQTPALRVSVAVKKSKPPTTHSVDAAVIELVGERDG